MICGRPCPCRDSGGVGRRWCAALCLWTAAMSSAVVSASRFSAARIRFSHGDEREQGGHNPTTPHQRQPFLSHAQTRSLPHLAHNAVAQICFPQKINILSSSPTRRGTTRQTSTILVPGDMQSYLLAPTRTNTWHSSTLSSPTP